MAEYFGARVGAPLTGYAYISLLRAITPPDVTRATSSKEKEMLEKILILKEVTLRWEDSFFVDTEHMHGFVSFPHNKNIVIELWPRAHPYEGYIYTIILSDISFEKDKNGLDTLLQTFMRKEQGVTS